MHTRLISILTFLFWFTTISLRPASQAQEPMPYDAALAASLTADALEYGDADRGAIVFTLPKLACVSCHRVGPIGGTIGPQLDRLSKDRTAQGIVESLYWPQREVAPEFEAWSVVTDSGRILRGILRPQDERQFLLQDVSTGQRFSLAEDQIEARTRIGSVMPEGLPTAMSQTQQRDLIRFLVELHQEGLSPSRAELLRHAHSHKPMTFRYEKDPLHPEQWPHHKHPRNKHRIYDFYAKQAEHFRQRHPTPHLLAGFPGLDGGQFGHWGFRNDAHWKDNRWNDTKLGTLQCGIFRSPKASVARGICVRFGDGLMQAACFNPDTLTYDAVWSGGFVRFDDTRHGFLGGIRIDGKPMEFDRSATPRQPYTYHGLYRSGAQVVFSYRIGDIEYLDAPGWQDGKFKQIVGPVESHPLRHVLRGGPRQWPESITTEIVMGTGTPYAVDTIGLPFDNPWNALLFCGGHDFLPDGSALICTMQGDVWRVTGLDSGHPGAGKATWTRFAAGLNQALGLRVRNGGVYVQCRDQLVRLHDLNADGEADFYECFSKAFTTSLGGHDYICGLHTDADGNFYTASGKQGLIQISADGQRVRTLATGLRNPDGLGIQPDGRLTVSCSEGDWTPASQICEVLPAGNQVQLPRYFGHGGLRGGQPPDLPLAYVPRGLDNSSGGQIYVDSHRWGPLQGQLVHLSFGMGRHFLLLRDEVAGQEQGAIVPLPGDFQSGIHRGRFRQRDGQLYVTGMDGWVSFTPQDGCFQRIRYTGDRVQLPIAFHTHRNGVSVRFTHPIDPEYASDPSCHFAQCWDYRFGPGYGSPEFAPSHPGVPGHEVLPITAAEVLADSTTLFVSLPDIQPVNQLHLRLRVAADSVHDLFLTVHALDAPFEQLTGYRAGPKVVRPHPLLRDIASLTQRTDNPWQSPLEGARPIHLRTGKSLSYETKLLRAKPGEPIALRLQNTDTVPHNWALIRPGTLQAIGTLTNHLISDPSAVARQYIPKSDDVLAYTDIVMPGKDFTIQFRVPSNPGRYPYLCTFPGHWMVMNGTLIVETPTETRDN